MVGQAAAHSTGRGRCITCTFSTTLCQTCCPTSIMGCHVTCWHGTMWQPARRNSLELSVGGLKEVYPKSKCYCINTRIMAANYATMLWIPVANLVYIYLHNFWQHNSAGPLRYYNTLKIDVQRLEQERTNSLQLCNLISQLFTVGR